MIRIAFLLEVYCVLHQSKILIYVFNLKFQYETYSSNAAAPIVNAAAEETGSCLACAALALARRPITVLFVGVIEVRGPPAKKGLFRVACNSPAGPNRAGVVPFKPFSEVGDAWLPFKSVIGTPVKN